MKILGKFATEVELKLSSNQLQAAQKLLNLYYIGEENCNHFDEDLNIVPKYPEKETKEFKDAHHACQMTYRVPVCINILENGRLQLGDLLTDNQS